MAHADRYVYMGAAFLLPALAVAIDALWRRWAPAALIGLGLLLVAVPGNMSVFGTSVFGSGFFREEKYVLTEVVRMPLAREVPVTYVRSATTTSTRLG